MSLLLVDYTQDSGVAKTNAKTLCAVPVLRCGVWRFRDTIVMSAKVVWMKWFCGVYWATMNSRTAYEKT